MAVATLPLTDTGPITEAERREVSSAYGRARKIRRAAAVAGFNGWGTVVLAALSAPFALLSLPGLAGLLLTAGMGLVGYNELRGRRRLLQFDPGAPALLGWNQLGFLALIVVYCLWSLAEGLTGESPVVAELANNPQLREALGSTAGVESLYRGVVTLFYGVVILLSLLFQGGNALYYFTRRKHVARYLQETPDWVRDVHRASAGG